MGLATDAVRRANLSQVLRMLHTEGAATRAQITAHTGLNRSTVGTLVAELAEVGLVSEGEPLPTGSRGRPSPLVSLVAMRTAVLVVDVKVDSVAAGVVGLGGHRGPFVRLQRPRVRIGLEATLDDLESLARKALADLSANQHLGGLAVSIAGLVDRHINTVSEGPNIGWTKVPLPALLLERLDLDVPTLLANDGDAGVWAEHLRGAAIGVDDVVYLSGEVGLGGGILVAGQPLGGAVGFAGEIGHMVVDAHGPRCGCGATGCLEVMVGEHALLRRAGYPEDGGREAVDAVVAAVVDGDATATAAMDETAEWLAIGVGNIVNAFNPRMIVLGDMHALLHPHVVDHVQVRLATKSLVGRRSPVVVVPAELGDDASAVGAAELALEPLLSDPLGHDLGPHEPGQAQ